MESTLPGAEWVKTFEGIINEPKLIVFNDSINKKLIVENGGEVDFAHDDLLAIYISKNNIIVEKEIDKTNFCKVDRMNASMIILSDIFPTLDVGDTFVTTNVLEVDGVEVTLTATLHLK